MPALPEHVDDLQEAHWAQWFARRGRLDLELLLLTVWDPIGVRDEPEAFDEYGSYAVQCLAPVRCNDAKALAASLTKIEHDGMGLFTRPDAVLSAAELIVEGARASAQRWIRAMTR